MNRYFVLAPALAVASLPGLSQSGTTAPTIPTKVTESLLTQQFDPTHKDYWRIEIRDEQYGEAWDDLNGSHVTINLDPAEPYCDLGTGEYCSNPFYEAWIYSNVYTGNYMYKDLQTFSLHYDTDELIIRGSDWYDLLYKGPNTGMIETDPGELENDSPNNDGFNGSINDES